MAGTFRAALVYAAAGASPSQQMQFLQEQESSSGTKQASNACFCRVSSAPAPPSRQRVLVCPPDWCADFPGSCILSLNCEHKRPGTSARQPSGSRRNKKENCVQKGEEMLKRDFPFNVYDPLPKDQHPCPFPQPPQDCEARGSEKAKAPTIQAGERREQPHPSGGRRGHRPAGG